jgi:hypothetical protein
MARAETKRLREDDVAAALRIIMLRVSAGIRNAADANELAEHDLLQDALSQLEVVRQLVERARAARSGE